MKKWSEKNGIEFWTMPVDRAADGLEVLRNGFFQDEAFCISFGLTEDVAGQKELEDLMIDIAQDELSIMAVDKDTRKIVGVSYNKFQTAVAPGEKNYFEKFRDTRCKNKNAKALISEMVSLDGLVDMYGKYKVDCSLELVFLGTHKDFRKRGIGAGCAEASLALAQTLPSLKCPKRPPIASAIFTSPYSIRIGRIFQFHELLCVSYQEKSYEGKRFCDNQRIGNDHPGAIIMVKPL